MTPKEKAEELIDNYYILLDGFVPFEQVKKCALIAVDEILEEMAFMWGHYANVELEAEERQIYWMEVKKEIEAL